MRNLMSYPLSFSSDSFPDVFHAFLRPVHQRAEDGTAGMDIDITEAGNEYILKAEIPGVSKEDITVEIEDNTVTIRVNKEQNKETEREGRIVRQERFWGRIERTISLSSSIDESGGKATYQDGLLTLTLPKKAGHENRKILIE